MICPLYKAALIQTRGHAYYYGTGEITKDIEKVVACDRENCETWNVVTGTCGLNNYSLTPLYTEDKTIPGL